MWSPQIHQTDSLKASYSKRLSWNTVCRLINTNEWMEMTLLNSQTAFWVTAALCHHLGHREMAGTAGAKRSPGMQGRQRRWAGQRMQAGRLTVPVVSSGDKWADGGPEDIDLVWASKAELSQSQIKKKKWAGPGNTHLKSQHLEDWAGELQVQSQPGLHSVTLYQNKINKFFKKKEKNDWSHCLNWI
jgi:hypothetical protein